MTASSCSLPSTNSARDLLAGTAGGLVSVAMSTILRAVLIAPGLYIAGVRGEQLALASLASSALISGFVLLWLWRNGCR